MSLEALRQVLRLADASAGALLNADDVTGWADGSLEVFAALGLLREDAPARVIVCPGCNMQCLKEVELVGEGKNTRGIIICDQRDDMEPIEVPLERLRRWTVDADALAQVLADKVRAIGGVEGIVAERLWWLGRSTFRAGRLDIFLVRGAGWSDAEEATWSAARFQECSRALVLSMYLSLGSALPGKVDLSLARVLSIEGDKLCLDREVIEDEVARRIGKSAHKPFRFNTPPGTTWEQVKIVIMPDEDAAQVSAGGVTEPVVPDQMGLSHARNPSKFSKLWSLLVHLSKVERIDSRSNYFDRTIPKSVERLRKKLREFFGIDGDPFKPYRQVKGYEPRFIIYKNPQD